MNHADDHYAHDGGVGAAAWVERHIRSSATQMQRIRDTVRLIPAETSTVLDVGAGHGVLLEELALARGLRGTGIEITPAKVDYARSRGVDMRLGTAERLDFDDRSFDTVLSCEVIEHLPFGVYERALFEIARVADRAVVLSVPNDERREFVRCPYCGATANPSYHLRSFKAESMAGLLPGFALQQIEYLGRHRSSPLLRLGRRLLDRAWPEQLVCPSCGYRTESEGRSVAVGSAAASGLRETARRWSSLIPARSKSTWLAAVYTRLKSR